MGDQPIILISPLPPPLGGIATWTHSLLTQGLPLGMPYTLIDTRIRGKRNIFTAARFNLAEAYRTVSIIFSLLLQLIIKRPRLVHLSSSLSPSGIFRDWVCAQLSNLFRVPLVTHLHGNLPDFNGAKSWGLSGKYLKQLLLSSSTIIVENKASKTEALAWVNSNVPVVLIPNFMEDHYYHPDWQKHQYKSPPLKALFVGGITGAKGCQGIVAAAQALPEMEFHLVGKMHADMEAHFTRAPSNVILHGPIAHEEVLRTMKEYDIFLFPSHTEGFPLSVLEAMTFGLPVVATKVGAIPEMIDDNRGGILVQPKQQIALIQALKTLLAHPEQLAEMGKYNAQKSRDHYRFSIVIEQIIAIYDAIAPLNPHLHDA